MCHERFIRVPYMHSLATLQLSCTVHMFLPPVNVTLDVDIDISTYMEVQ